VGEGVDGVRVGDPVAWAMVHGAGYAEQVVVPAAKLLPVPDGVDLETAAAVLLQGLTVQYLTTSTFEVTDGDVVLVHAAAGGVGLLLTQVCAERGARVIGTVSTPEKAELARAAGASDIVMYREQDVAEAVRDLTGGRGADVVYDGVGAATWQGSLASLRPRGMMVLYGASSGAPPEFQPEQLGKLGSLFLTRPSLAHHIASRDELAGRAAEVFEWVRQGRLEVRVGGRYPLEAAGRAHEDLEGRRSTGKLLVLPRA
jgi:NADPH2:quinone reductase